MRWPQMANYTVDPTAVIASSRASKFTAPAGVAINAGQSVYVAADGTLGLYDANAAAPANVFAGIALDSGAAGQPIVVAKTDPNFGPGFTLAAGEVVVGSATPGGLCPVADLASGTVPTVVGVGIGGNKMDFAPFSGGVAKP